MEIKKCKTCGTTSPEKYMAWFRGKEGVCRECVKNMSDQEFKDLLVMEAALEDDNAALRAFEKMGFI